MAFFGDAITGNLASKGNFSHSGNPLGGTLAVGLFTNASTSPAAVTKAHDRFGNVRRSISTS
jgi:hypothetical protein